MTDTSSISTEARIDVVRGAENRHSLARAASRGASSGEEWLCKCGAHYRGEGAIEKGRRHGAAEILVALDSVAVSA